MCGIFGILKIDNGASIESEKFLSALETISHRGPDAINFKEINDEVFFGHTRLSIIDLTSGSNQPMNLLDRYWLIFNGEIFNYIELRGELESYGIKFHTTGDAEVLLYSYMYWGEDCVNKFNGMWSFAIYDTEEKSLFCSRDRFGEKPFNYVIYEGKFYFSSEIKSIIKYEPRLRKPNYNVISNFCRTSVGAQHQETWFENILRLPPGCNLIFKNGNFVIRKYWSYPKEKESKISFADACAHYKNLFIDAVRIRMRSDVPVGVTLSAGLDSTSIAYAMREIDPNNHYSFTSSFQENEKPIRDAAIYVDSNEMTDEAEVAQNVANEIKFKSVIVHTDYAKFIFELGHVIYHLESGNGSPAIIPLMQLHNNIRLNSKVVLEGQGADELLCGYVGSLVWQSIFDNIRYGRFRLALTSLKNFSKTYKIKHSVLLLLRSVSNYFPLISEINQKLKGIDKIFGPQLRRYRHMPDYPEFSVEDQTNSVRNELRKQHSGILVNLLHYGDATSMANGVESRLPFLDYRLVEFVWSLPSNFKINAGIGKYIHREAMRGLVPDHVIDNPIKYGFCTPVNELFRRNSKNINDPVKILLSDRCIRRGLFDKNGLARLIELHQSGKQDHGNLLFRLLSTELWFQCFIDSDSFEFEFELVN